jgi:hypothetical protein
VVSIPKSLVHGLSGLSLFILGFLSLGAALAQQGDPSLEADKACTLCHNESWRTPVLSI